MKSFLLAGVLTGIFLMPLQAATPNADPSSPTAKKESYQKQVEADLNRLSKKIDDLHHQSEKAGADTRAQVNHEMDSLDKKLQAAQNKLTTFKEQTEDDWEKWRTGLDKAVKDLEKSCQKTASKFKG